eukprot:TRINITY_DN7336_c0_g1_i1.p2 TRINITY_DN7336_c0_g1~~TRINITY_DN7336_c0_g1_i1.p2  ORF type:complete len:239 (+),score=16.02 TRINITY_DN7336_c0_g1_i1:178-894(+)
MSSCWSTSPTCTRATPAISWTARRSRRRPLLRVTLKGLRVISHLLVGLLLAVLVKLGGRGRYSRENLGTWWHQVLLRILEVKVVVRGERLPGTRVMVANHISWLDIPVVGACEPTRFVSKAEVGEWPVIGWLADAYGTFYLRRGSGGTKQLIESIDEHLGHDSIVFFPEGTTTDGSIVLKFQPRLFATAIETQRAPAWPTPRTRRSAGPWHPTRSARPARVNRVALSLPEQTLGHQRG